MEKKYSEAEGEYTKALGIDSTSVGPDVSVAERTSVVAAGNAAGDQLQTTSL